MQYTSLIDIVFLLLIFFMVGLKLRELDRKLEADLPRTGAPPKDSSPLINEIWVRIDDENKGRSPTPRAKVVVDQVVMAYRPDPEAGGQPTPWPHTRSTLQRLAQAPQAREDPVIIAPTDEARHGWVMKVMDILRELRYKNINFKQ
jgi:biopolymer transport protein ExbD